VLRSAAHPAYHSAVATPSPRQRVEELVEATLPALPEPLRSAAAELLVVVEGRDPGGDLYGCFEGVPRGESNGYGELPPRIVLFATTLVEDFGRGDGLAAEVRRTLVHEIGHYLGIGEAELHRRGLE